MSNLLSLFASFAKVGAFTFGGGYAMLPLLQRELVEKKKWVTDDDLMDYYAIGQCTPGVIAVNTATFIGYKEKGVLGAIFATLGVITPSIVIITLITAFITHFSDNPYVIHAFNGIRVCVVVLIFNSVVKLAAKSLLDWISWCVFVLIILLSLFTDIPTVLLIVFVGAVGVVKTLFLHRKGQKGGSK